MQWPDAPPKLRIEPLETSQTFRHLAYETLKKAIAEMDIYSHPEEIELPWNVMWASWISSRKSLSQTSVSMIRQSKSG